MRPAHRALITAFIFTALVSAVADAQRVGGGDRTPPLRRPLPAVEGYAPAAGVYEVVSVEPSNRLVRLRSGDGKTADVSVAEHVYDLSKLKAGDRVKVDFFQPDDANPTLSAAGIWPVEAVR
jgi:hypothetical protein